MKIEKIQQGHVTCAVQVMREAAIKIQKWWRQKKIVQRLKQMRSMLPYTGALLLLHIR